MNGDKAYHIIKRHFDGTLPPRYRRMVAHWLLSGDSEEEQQAALGRIWNEAPQADDGALEEALRTHRSRRDAYEATRRRKLRLRRVLKYAAAVALPLFLMAAAWTASCRYHAAESRMMVCQVPDGQTRRLLLSDGSELTVNGGSKVIYPEKFGHGGSRNVFVSGEVFFDVAHDAARPFVVNAENLTIRVLGTRFNLRAYSDENSITTTLLRGSVRVAVDDTALVLRPDEQAVYARLSKKISKFGTHAADEASWIDGRLSFDQQPLSRIIPVLVHKYGVKFSVDSSISMAEKYTMNFEKNESLHDVLDILAQIAANIDYQMNGNHVTLYRSRKEGARR
ncbi:FecR family protein [Prevotella sp. kh1p2]|uniref:FecR family protein n=1 Tax=Prevotella sp. kh1p2 TaxID=1761883 RepID=UPI0008AAE89A|nr:FecR family protein [Prevotella sp. kh1p2]SES89989.1 FecR family protein [Prevotella sp. kh1p2]SNU11612.1 FecR family protein [Prevotellaceae bacterium KH2P17]